MRALNIHLVCCTAAFNLDCVRFLWVDSSPLARFDWLWSQYIEIDRVRLVGVFKSALSLEVVISAYAESLLDCADIHVFYTPLPEWKPFLEMLLVIREYILTPGAMASGMACWAVTAKCPQIVARGWLVM